jgi:hypothetical protein
MPNDKKLTPMQSQASVEPEKLKHPNAFLAGDGRTLYRYKFGDNELILPKPEEEMTQQDFFDLRIASPSLTAGRLPQYLTVKFKDPQWAGHWFNKKAGSGRRVSDARAMGFVPAKVEDLESYYGELTDKDGAVENNDLVLMKIHKSILYLTQAQYIAQAKRDGGIEAYKDKASVGMNPANSSTDPYFLTPQARGEYQGVGPVTHIPEVNR